MSRKSLRTFLKKHTDTDTTLADLARDVFPEWRGQCIESLARYLMETEAPEIVWRTYHRLAWLYRLQLNIRHHDIYDTDLWLTKVSSITTDNPRWVFGLVDISPSLEVHVARDVLTKRTYLGSSTRGLTRVMTPTTEPVSLLALYRIAPIAAFTAPGWELVSKPELYGLRRVRDGLTVPIQGNEVDP